MKKVENHSVYHEKGRKTIFLLRFSMAKSYGFDYKLSMSIFIPIVRSDQLPFEAWQSIFIDKIQIN